MCSTPMGLRCCNSNCQRLRSPCKNQCAGYPRPHSWKARKETTSSGRGSGKTVSGSGALQPATDFGGSSPLHAKSCNKSSLTVDSLQSDIVDTGGGERICKFFPFPLLLSLLELTAASEEVFDERSLRLSRQGSGGSHRWSLHRSNVNWCSSRSDGVGDPTPEPPPNQGRQATWIGQDGSGTRQETG